VVHMKEVLEILALSSSPKGEDETSF